MKTWKLIVLMQACYEGLTFAEAVDKYKEIRQDPRLAYYGNAMGVELHDESLEDYDGYAFPLVEGSVIEGGNLDYMKALAVHPLAREALEMIWEVFPEYRFVAPAEIKESFYLEHMTTDELAGVLLDLAKEFDTYEFMDQVENLEDALMEIKYNLLAGKGMQEYAAFLKDVKEESRELAPKAEALLGKLKEHSPELTEEIQPMVKIQFSQDPEFKEGSTIPLAEADERLRAEDERQSDFNANHSGKARVLIVSYEIIYAEEDQMKSVVGTAFIGDGRGGLLGNLQQEVEEHLHNQACFFHLHQKFIKGNGRPNGTIYVVFEIFFPAVSPLILHIFFIGLCFLSGRHGLFQTIFQANAIAEFTDLVIIPLVRNVFVVVHKICCVKNQMAMDVILINVSGKNILMFPFQRCVSNLRCNFMSDIRICDFTWFEGNDHVPGKVVSFLHHIVFSYLCSHRKFQIGSFR